MVTSIVCAIIGMAIVAYLTRVARRTGAACRSIYELEYNAHEYIALNRPGFYQECKWEVKVD